MGDYHAVISWNRKLSLKNFRDTKFVYHKIAELLVFVGTNTVTHLLKEFAFSRLVIKISPIDCSFDCVSLIFIFLLFETHRVNTTNISPGV